MKTRIQCLALTMCLLILTAGCRNRCNNPYGGGLFAGGSPTIAAPATYSLNIPSVAKNQPYYVPGPANNSTLNPNGRAPTPQGRQATQPNQAGWKSAENDLSKAGSGIRSEGDAGRSVLAPTSFVQTGAASRPMQSTGQAFTNSQNYRTTSIDERQDATRLPVTDASFVRAPASNYPPGTRMVASNNGYPSSNYNVGYSAPVPQTYVGQNGVYAGSASGYTASPVIVSGQPMLGYQSSPVLVSPGQFQRYPQGYPTSGPPTVLAESTASSTGRASQIGWRDRDLTSGRTGRY